MNWTKALSIALEMENSDCFPLYNDKYMQGGVAWRGVVWRGWPACRWSGFRESFSELTWPTHANLLYIPLTHHCHTLTPSATLPGLAVALCDHPLCHLTTCHISHLRHVSSSAFNLIDSLRELYVFGSNIWKRKQLHMKSMRYLEKEIRTWSETNESL